MKPFHQLLLCLLALPLNFLILKVAWNWIVPGITGWTHITYWQSAGIFIIYWSLHGLVHFTISTRQKLIKE